MKLLRIKVCNLNSLYGEHDLDLEGALGGAPLFLIVGPTGAGKSTLMDAISLALFGQTPRLPLSRSDSDPDGDSRNVMSRGTGMCAASVELRKIEGGRPVRYRATWECWRARKSPDGKAQTPRRTLERFDAGHWITLVSDDREKFYGEAFASLLEGMTVEDFKRSMLLAQGEFSAFLKADEDERASILERLTNTSLYKELGTRARERWQEAKRALDLAEQAVGGVSLLDDAQEASLRDEAEALTGAWKDQVAQVAELEAAAQWLRRKAVLEQALDEAVRRSAQTSAEWEAARPELAQLEQHERCQEAAAPLADRDRLSAERAKGERELPLLEEDEHALQERLTRATQERDALANQVEEAKRKIEHTSPEIAAARTARAELSAAERELTKAIAELDEKQRAAEAANGERARLEAEVRRLDAAREIAQANVAALEPARPLAEAIAGWRERAQTLRQRAEESRTRAVAMESERRALAQERESLAKLGAQGATLEERVRALEGVAGAAVTAREALLEGAEDVQARRRVLRGHAERESERRRALQELARHWTERDRHAGEAERLAQALARVEVSRQSAVAEAGRVSARTSVLEEDLARWSRELEDQRWFQTVALERQRLVDGESCPLCGSVEHPALHDGRFADLDAQIEERCRAVTQRIDAARVELKGLQAQTLACERTIAAAKTEADQLTLRLDAERSARAEWEARIAASLVRFDWTAEREEDLARFASECDAAIQRWATLEAELDAAEGKAVSAREEAQAARAEWERVQAGAQALRDRASERAARLERSAEQHRSAEERWAMDDAALKRELAAFQLDVERGIAEALQEAGGRVDSLRRADTDLTRVAQEGQVAAAALSSARARAEAASAAQEAALLARTSRAQTVDPLRARCSELLGGDDPERVERDLQQQLAQAQGRAEQARASGERLGRERTAAATRLAERRASLAETRKQADEASLRLEGILRRIGVSDVETLRRTLLPEEALRALTAKRAALSQAADTAEALRAAKETELHAHLAARPPGLAEDVLEDAVGARKAELEQRAAELQQRIGAIGQQLRAQAQGRAQLGEKRAHLEKVAQAFALWDRLHRLIGIRDGDAFKGFAQTLNLAELIDRANAHLERLAPRYRLTGATNAAGESRLAFAVKDALQADTARPVSTLSGGETFLVSLALALGLASYRTVRMPIETLLLDEGFGTLDPQTLQVAMAALEALHASGTQVGIISHVEALKERIPARIVVERVGNGRSAIRIEAA